MNKFLDKIFKPYLFPIIILIAGVYLKTGKNLNNVTEYFLESSNSFIRFFSNEFYLWEVILYLIVIFILNKLYKLVFKPKSKKERKMLRAIKKSASKFYVKINGTTDKYIFKYSASVENEQYNINNLRPYCNNCEEKPIRMTEIAFLEFTCNCGRQIEYITCNDVKSRIITDLEEME